METLELIASKVFTLDNVEPLSKEIKTKDPLPTENRIFTSGKFEVQHSNYLTYLEVCWNNHIPIVLKPDYIWQLLLCEIATHIKNNAETYRHLFTENEGKTEIVVYTSDPIVLPLDSVMNELRRLVPTGVDKFLLRFSTSTSLSVFATNAAFADAMSPYYNYSMLMCGFPKIRVEGSVDDWKSIIDSLNEIKKILVNLTVNTSRIEDIINAIETDNGDVFKTMFSLKRCGSGHQTQVDGWITDFYIKKPRPGYVGNYSSSISDVEYKNLTTNKNYLMKVGLLGSNFENEFLVPEFGYAIYDKA